VWLGRGAFLWETQGRIPSTLGRAFKKMNFVIGQVAAYAPTKSFDKKTHFNNVFIFLIFHFSFL
jgi:hypothetical protein